MRRPYRSTNCVTVFIVSVCAFGDAQADVRPVVEVEEVVTSYAPANNGAGPMWCYGSTCITRQGEDVYVSTIETGEGVPRLCNTRWQLWHRGEKGWRLAQHEANYRQREPCPIASFGDGSIFLSVNPSTRPPGVEYGPCKPMVLGFDPSNPAETPSRNEPAWADGTSFTDHSYRGFAADGAAGELLLLNINNKTSAQFVSFRDANGRWHAKGTIEFPIRACYPQAALRDHAAHVMAIGDIVEPVDAWRKLKFEKLHRKWDYVFRQLFYSHSPDITKTVFTEPIEIDTVEKTGGSIRNLDLYVDASGAAHLLYLKRPHQYAFLRDKYFAGQPMTAHLEYVVIEAGKVQSRRTLAETPSDGVGLTPSNGRFHVAPGGKLYVVAVGSHRDEAGNLASGNWLGKMDRRGGRPVFTHIKLEHPFGSFYTTTPRGGSKPSDFIELFGIADDNPNLRYARIRLAGS